MAEKKPKILLAEDDLSFGKILRDYLCINGYEVVHTKDGMEGWNTFRHHHFDLCILDVMMPGRDGFELAEMIRKQNAQVPLLILTAKNKKEDMLTGFSTGADDYLLKPVDADILLMKVKALLKRSNLFAGTESSECEFTLGSFRFSYPTRTLQHHNSEQLLSPKEADLLRLLCLHRDSLLKREDILRKLWKEVNYFNGRSLDVYITKLRKYLSADPAIQLSSLHRSGYILKTAKQEVT